MGDGPAAATLAAAYPEARLLGWKSPAEVRQHLRGARALVFPSLWYEGQPLTVLEAQALGTPVVVSDGCAGREEVEDGRSGLWFRSGDAAALAAALRTLSSDDIVARLSDAAYRRYWADPPTLARHVRAITAGYRGLLPAPLEAEVATAEAA